MTQADKDYARLMELFQFEAYDRLTDSERTEMTTLRFGAHYAAFIRKGRNLGPVVTEL